MTIFEETVRNLTAKQIIELMIDAVQNPAIKLNFDTFGSVENGDRVGCAATNAVCKIADKKFDEDSIIDHYIRADFIDCDREFLEYFENAIDRLRRGVVSRYNFYAKYIGIALIEAKEGLELPKLRNGFTPDQLEPYRELAEYQKENL